MHCGCSCVGGSATLVAVNLKGENFVVIALHCGDCWSGNFNNTDIQTAKQQSLQSN